MRNLESNDSNQTSPCSLGACRQPPLFWFRIRKWTQSFVFRKYMIVHSFFVCTPLTFLPLPEEAGDMLSPPFLILDSKMDSIVCILLVHECIRLLSFVHLLLFYLSLNGLGTCYPSFSDFGFENEPNHYKRCRSCL